MDLNLFMLNQPTSPEAIAMLQRLWDQLSSKPLFLAANSYRIGEDYTFGLRSKLNDRIPGEDIELEVTEDGIPSLEFELVLFGEIVVTPLRGVPGSIDPQDETLLSKKCFVHKNKVHDLYGIRMPQKSSPDMATAYRHQLSELRDIVRHVANYIGIPPPEFCDNSTGVSLDHVDFDFASPPTWKMGDPPRLNDILFVIRDPIVHDLHPRYPRDELYDLQQIRRCNSTGFEVFDRNATVIFKGKLKFWVNRNRNCPLKWLFMSDDVKVIAQDE